MATLTRKQREVQDREQRILEVALQMLLASGYHGLNMDRIAAALEYSKGTIYQHFSCKEEILLALANRAVQVRLDLFRRAAAFKGRSRERLQGVGVAADLFVRLYPHYFHVEQVIRLASVWEKTSEDRRQFLRWCEEQCMGIVAGIARDAVAAGDLVIAPPGSPEDVVFGMWSLSFGAATITTTSTSLIELGIVDPRQALRWNQLTLMDGYGWKPLSKDYDVAAVDERLAKEVFAAEMTKASQG